MLQGSQQRYFARVSLLNNIVLLTIKATITLKKKNINRKSSIKPPPPMVGGMVQNSANQNHYQHQQQICSSPFFFYINNKICPTSTINIIINIRNIPRSTKIALFFNDDLPHNQHRISTSTTKHVQEFGDERLTMVEGGWDPEILITGHTGK